LSDLNTFNNILYGQDYLQTWGQYTGCYCLKNFLTKDIGLHPQGKPGEIDILLIPFDKTQTYFDRSSAFEVKVAKPHFENIKKGANSDGYSQVMGLVHLGFPYVGLIHIIASRPLPAQEKHNIKSLKRPANAVETPGRKLPGVDEYEMMKWDWLPFYAEINQKKRMLSYDIPKYVGLKTITINFYADHSYSLGFSQDLRDFDTGFINPHRSKETVEKVDKHFKKNRRRYRKIVFTFSGQAVKKNK
jgi:hypothetical protein